MRIPGCRSCGFIFENILDFYLLSDEKPKPHTVHDLTFAGQLGEESFHYLVEKGFVDNRFDYYADFRWNSALVDQILKKISDKDFERKNPVVDLLVILQKAKSANCGLIAVAD
jgi:hypothetical protein